jgi:hypothetical protein
MLDGELLEAIGAVYPDAGTLRVHPDPSLLLPAEPEVPGRNRYDDPEGRVAVRYTATQLLTCLKETMARFRPNTDAEARLAAIDGIEANDVDWDSTETSAVSEWLAKQQVGTVRVLPSGVFVDVEHDQALIALDKHPSVRAAIEPLDPSGRLDTGHVRLGGPHGRRITQAVGTAVREWLPAALGVGYHPRLATDEACWAIWEGTQVDVLSTPLDPSNEQHRHAVNRVAALFEIGLSPTWDAPED